MVTGADFLSAQSLDHRPYNSMRLVVVALSPAGTILFRMAGRGSPTSRRDRDFPTGAIVKNFNVARWRRASLAWPTVRSSSQPVFPTRASLL